MTPVGTWRSIDDETKKPKAQIVVSEHDGALSGKIEQLLRPGADPKELCTECTGDRKDKPMVGLEIIRGAKKAEGPEKGKDYALRLTPIDGGQKLEVRGSIGPFWRTQTWQRVK